MKRSRGRVSVHLAVLLVAIAAPGPAAAEGDDARLAQWTAPPYWTPPASAAHERRALAAGPTALPFIALPPCRLVDTRGNAPLTGGFLPAATVRSYTLTGVCGVPATALAVSLNATVVHPTGPGFLTLWPEGGAFPPVSTLNYLGNDVIVNAAVVPLSGTGGISMALGVSGGDVILDTNGYYAAAPSVTSLNTLTGDVTLAGIAGVTVTPSGSTLTIAPPLTVTTLTGTNGISASPSAGAVTVTSNATYLNTPSAIVARDPTGSFSAGSIGVGGNLNLSATAANGTAGVLLLGGSRFLHSWGSNNTYVGSLAGNFTGTGFGNTAVGYTSLTSNTSGDYNTATGPWSLTSNSSGGSNTAFGFESLFSNTTGDGNTAHGYLSLGSSTTGNYNIAVGFWAGLNLTSGSNNVYIGNPGLASESNVIRIGSGSGGITSQHFSFFVAAVRGVTTGIANAIPVLVDTNGQLGTASSSIRFKDDVRDMGEESAKLMQLRPVTFRYKAHGPDGPKQYGLIAEEVDQVMPELVARSKDGEIETVMYHELPAILLNEIQRLERRVAELEKRLSGAAGAPER